MNREQQPLLLDERTQNAINELQNTIAERYPTAKRSAAVTVDCCSHACAWEVNRSPGHPLSFELSRGIDDPGSINIITTVDVDDPDEVGDLVVDRVIDLLVEDQIPIHVIPIRTPERVRADIQAQASSSRQRRRRTIPLWSRLPLGDQ